MRKMHDHREETLTADKLQATANAPFRKPKSLGAAVCVHM